MAKKLTEGIEPNTTPTRRKPDDTEAVDNTAATVAATEIPAPAEPEKTSPAGKKSKRKEDKDEADRHPITATIPIAKREHLVAYAGSVTADTALNPKGTRVTLGTLASMFTEQAAAITSGDKSAADKLAAALTSDDPAAAIARLAVEYKQAQKAS